MAIETKCGQPAWAKMYWPGKEPMLVCARHSRMAYNVAQAIGLHLVQEDVDGGECEHAAAAAG